MVGDGLQFIKENNSDKKINTFLCANFFFNNIPKLQFSGCSGVITILDFRDVSGTALE
jgi:hypothetical protein